MKSKRPAIWDTLGQQIQPNRVKIGVATALAVISVALLVLHGLLADVRAQDVGVAFRALSTWQVALALGLTAISYLLLTIYDVLALAMIGKKLPYPDRGPRFIYKLHAQPQSGSVFADRRISTVSDL